MSSSFRDLERFNPEDILREAAFNTGEIEMAVSWSSSDIPVQILTLDDGRDYLLRVLEGLGSPSGGAAFATLSGVDGIHMNTTADPLFTNVDIGLLEMLTRDLSTTPLTAAEETDLENLLKSLMALATPLRIRSFDLGANEQPIHPQSGLLGRDLVEGIDTLIRSLEEAGVITSKGLIDDAGDLYGVDGEPTVPDLSIATGAAGTAAWTSWRLTWDDTPDPATQLVEAANAARVRTIADVGGVQTEILPSPLSTPEQSLQDLIRFEYVQAGHDLIFDAIKGLHDRLGLVEQSMDLLNSIQTVLNEKVPADIDMKLRQLWDVLNQRTADDEDDVIAIDINVDVDNVDDVDPSAEYATRVQNWEKSVFDQEIPAEYRDTAENRAVITGAFPDYVMTGNFSNTSTTPGSILNHIVGKITEVEDNFAALGITDDPILERLSQLKDDIGAANSGTSSLSNYVSDFETEGGPANNRAQKGLNSAFNTVQGQNDAAKEQLRRRMFEFEEFIKSASSLILKISQIIEKMAQGVRGV